MKPSDIAAAFRDVSEETATLILRIWNCRDEPNALKELIEQVPQAARYVNTLFFNPYPSKLMRRTLVLYAIDKLIGTHGVESLSLNVSYLNAGDTYNTTFLFLGKQDLLVIGCLGDYVS